MIDAIDKLAESIAAHILDGAPRLEIPRPPGQYEVLLKDDLIAYLIEPLRAHHDAELAAAKKRIAELEKLVSLAQYDERTRQYVIDDRCVAYHKLAALLNKEPTP